MLMVQCTITDTVRVTERVYSTIGSYS